MVSFTLFFFFPETIFKALYMYEIINNFSNNNLMQNKEHETSI